MAHKIGLIQPGKIGDIIICLPIAQYYRDLGNEVVWPIDHRIISNFFHYADSWNKIHFIPCEFDVNDAKKVCISNKCDKMLDVSFNIPGSLRINTENYIKQEEYSFDQYKYFLAEVPFDNKWNFKIKRNPEREFLLSEKIVDLASHKEYGVFQLESSDCRIELKNDVSYKKVIINNLTDSLFDWIGILENASHHFLIESCFSNLIDQLGMNIGDHNLILKKNYYQTSLKDGRLRGIPVLKLPWNYISLK